MRLIPSLIGLLFCLVSPYARSQEKFPKKELYAVWMTAEDKLDQGRMDEALSLYRAYPKDSSFMLRVRQVQLLQSLVAEGDRLLKKGQSAEALDKFKEYRKFRAMGTLGFMEAKIEQCLQKINQGRLSELTSQQRVIAGFELAHRGRAKLSQLDTLGARRDFTNAKTLGGNRNNILKEQYTEGLRLTEELTLWGHKHLSSRARTPAEELAALESYRNLRNLDIPAIELRMKELKSSLVGTPTLAELARLCDLDLLIQYIETHRSTVDASEFFLNRLREFKNTRQKISVLKANTAYAETVKSAYASLLSWTEDLPGPIRPHLRTCIQEEYAAYVATLPVSPAPVDRPCPGIDNFNRTVTLARRELAQCNLLRSKALWGEALAFVKDCNYASDLLKGEASLQDSLLRFMKSDSLLPLYRARAQAALQAGDCRRLRETLTTMQSLPVCNQEVLEAQIQQVKTMLSECFSGGGWKPQLIGSFSGVTPRYYLGERVRDMSTGWMTTVGMELAYIDHASVVEFALGLQYFTTTYYSLDAFSSVDERFRLGGAMGGLGMKLHIPHAQPGKIKPYLRVGPDFMIPMTYQYTNYVNASTNNDRKQLQQVTLFMAGGLGLEVQKEHFGLFAEMAGAAGLGNLYTSEGAQWFSSSEKLQASLTRFGVRIGMRFW